MTSHTHQHRETTDREARLLAFAELPQVGDHDFHDIRDNLAAEQQQQPDGAAAMGRPESPEERIAKLVGDTNNVIREFQERFRELPQPVGDAMREQIPLYIKGSVQTAERNGVPGLSTDEFNGLLQQVTTGIREVLDSIVGGVSDGKSKAQREQEEKEREAKRSIDQVRSDMEARNIDELVGQRVNQAALEDVEHPERIQEELQKFEKRQQSLQTVQAEIQQLGVDIQDYHKKAGETVKKMMEPPAGAAHLVTGGAAIGAAVGVWFFGVGALVGAAIGAGIGYLAYFAWRAIHHGVMSAEAQQKADDCNKSIDAARKRFAAGQKKTSDTAGEVAEDGKLLSAAPAVIGKKQRELHEKHSEVLDKRQKENQEQKKKSGEHAENVAKSQGQLQGLAEELEKRHKDLQAHRKAIADNETSLYDEERNIKDNTSQIVDAVRELESALKLIPEGHPQRPALQKQLESLQKAHQQGGVGLDQLEKGRKELEESGKVVQEQEQETTMRQTDLDAHGRSLEETLKALRGAIEAFDTDIGHLTDTREVMEKSLKQQLEGMGKLGGDIAKESLRANVMNVKSGVEIGLARQRIATLPTVETPSFLENVVQGSLKGIGEAVKFIFAETIGHGIDVASKWLKDIPVVNVVTSPLWFTMDVVSGAIHGASEMVEGIFTMLAHPVATAQGLATLFKFGSEECGTAWAEMGKALISWKEFENGEVGKGIGKIALNVVMTATGIGAVGTGGKVAGGLYAVARAQGVGVTRAAASAAVRGAWQGLREFGSGAAKLPGWIIRDLPRETLSVMGKLAAAPYKIVQHFRTPRGARLEAAIARDLEALGSVTTKIDDFVIGGRNASEIPGVAGKSAQELASMSGAELIAAGITDGASMRELLHFRSIVGEMEGLQAALTSGRHAQELRAIAEEAGGLNQATTTRTGDLLERLSYEARRSPWYEGDKLGQSVKMEKLVRDINFNLGPQRSRAFQVLESTPGGSLIAFDEAGVLKVIRPEEVSAFIQRGRSTPRPGPVLPSPIAAAPESGSALRVFDNADGARMRVAEGLIGKPLTPAQHTALTRANRGGLTLEAKQELLAKANFTPTEIKTLMETVVSKPKLTSVASAPGGQIGAAIPRGNEVFTVQRTATGEVGTLRRVGDKLEFETGGRKYSIRPNDAQREFVNAKKPPSPQELRELAHRQELRGLAGTVADDPAKASIAQRLESLHEMAKTPDRIVSRRRWYGARQEYNKLDDVVATLSKDMGAQPQNAWKILDATADGGLIAFDGKGVLKLYKPDQTKAFIEVAQNASRAATKTPTGVGLLGRGAEGKPLLKILDSADTARGNVAEVLTGRKLTPTQHDAVLRAHNMFATEGRTTPYTKVELRAKAKELKNAGFTTKEIDTLMRSGVTGQSAVLEGLTIRPPVSRNARLIMDPAPVGPGPVKPPVAAPPRAPDAIPIVIEQRMNRGAAVAGRPEVAAQMAREPDLVNALNQASKEPVLVTGRNAVGHYETVSSAGGANASGRGGISLESFMERTALEEFTHAGMRRRPVENVTVRTGFDGKKHLVYSFDDPGFSPNGRSMVRQIEVTLPGDVADKAFALLQKNPDHARAFFASAMDAPAANAAFRQSAELNFAKNAFADAAANRIAFVQEGVAGRHSARMFTKEGPAWKEFKFGEGARPSPAPPTPKPAPAPAPKLAPAPTPAPSNSPMAVPVTLDSMPPADALRFFEMNQGKTVKIKLNTGGERVEVWTVQGTLDGKVVLSNGKGTYLREPPGRIADRLKGAREFEAAPRPSPAPAPTPAPRVEPRPAPVQPKDISLPTPEHPMVPAVYRGEGMMVSTRVNGKNVVLRLSEGDAGVLVSNERGLFFKKPNGEMLPMPKDVGELQKVLRPAPVKPGIAVAPKPAPLAPPVTPKPAPAARIADNAAELPKTPLKAGDEVVMLRNDGTLLRGRVKLQDGEWHVVGTRENAAKVIDLKNPVDAWHIDDIRTMREHQLPKGPQYDHLRLELRSREAAREARNANRGLSSESFNALFPKNAVLQQGDIGNCWAVSALASKRQFPYFEQLMSTSITEVRAGGKVIAWEVRVPLGQTGGEVVRVSAGDISRAGRSTLPINAPPGYRILEVTMAKLEARLRPNTPAKTRLGRVNLNVLDDGLGHEALQHLFGPAHDYAHIKTPRMESTFANNIRRAEAAVAAADTPQAMAAAQRQLRKAKSTAAEMDQYFQSFSNQRDIGTINTRNVISKTDKDTFTVRIGGVKQEFYYQHAYSIQSVDRLTKPPTITIVNPHNTAKPITMTFAEATEVFSDISSMRVNANALFQRGPVRANGRSVPLRDRSVAAGVGSSAVADAPGAARTAAPRKASPTPKAEPSAPAPRPTGAAIVDGPEGGALRQLPDQLRTKHSDTLKSIERINDLEAKVAEGKISLKPSRDPFAERAEGLRQGRDLWAERGNHPEIDRVIKDREQLASDLRRRRNEARRSGNQEEFNSLDQAYRQNQDRLGELRFYRQHADYMRAGPDVIEVVDVLTAQQMHALYPIGDWVTPHKKGWPVIRYRIKGYHNELGDLFDTARGFTTLDEWKKGLLPSTREGSWAFPAGGRGRNDSYMRPSVASDAAAAPMAKNGVTRSSRQSIATNTFNYYERKQLVSAAMPEREFFLSRIDDLSPGPDGFIRTAGGKIYAAEGNASRLQVFTPSQVKSRPGTFIPEVKQPFYGRDASVRLVHNVGELPIEGYGRAALDLQKRIADELFNPYRFGKITDVELRAAAGTIRTKIKSTYETVARSIVGDSVWDEIVRLPPAEAAKRMHALPPEQLSQLKALKKSMNNLRAELRELENMPRRPGAAVETGTAAREAGRTTEPLTFKPKKELPPSTFDRDLVPRDAATMRRDVAQRIAAETNPNELAKLQKQQAILHDILDGKVTLEKYKGVRDLGKGLQLNIAEQKELMAQIVRNAKVRSMDDLIKLSNTLPNSWLKRNVRIAAPDALVNGKSALGPSLNKLDDICKGAAPMEDMGALIRSLPEGSVERKMLQALHDDLARLKGVALDDAEKAIIFRESMEYLADYQSAIGAGGFGPGTARSSQEIFGLLRQNQRKLAHQTLFDRKYLTGSDHGVLHVLEADMRWGSQIATEMVARGKMTPQQKLLLRQATIDHDLGYAFQHLDRLHGAGDAYFAMTKDHPLFSALALEHNAPYYVRYFGRDGYELLRGVVLDHSDAMNKAGLAGRGRELVGAILAQVDCMGVSADFKMMKVFKDPEMVAGLLRAYDVVMETPALRTLADQLKTLKKGSAEYLAAEQQFAELSQPLVQIKEGMLEMLRSRYPRGSAQEAFGVAFEKSLQKFFSPLEPEFAAMRDMGSHNISMMGLGVKGDTVVARFATNQVFDAALRRHPELSSLRDARRAAATGINETVCQASIQHASDLWLLGEKWAGPKQATAIRDLVTQARWHMRNGRAVPAELAGQLNDALALPSRAEWMAAKAIGKAVEDFGYAVTPREVTGIVEALRSGRPVRFEGGKVTFVIENGSAAARTDVVALRRVIDRESALRRSIDRLRNENPAEAMRALNECASQFGAHSLATPFRESPSAVLRTPAQLLERAHELIAIGSNDSMAAARRMLEHLRSQGRGELGGAVRIAG